jgi:SanA protein
MLATAILGAVLFVAVGLVLGLRAWTDWRYRARTFALADVPTRPVALVFGAGVWPDGRLSDILADRVATAAELYHLGKVGKLLMSGDNRYADYNEPAHMRAYALELGVPDEDIVLDYAGRRTYDSCYRAVHIFRVDAAILVTQAYHLDRALLIANRLGIDAVGVPADKRNYIHIRSYWVRELPATLVAWWQVTVSHPLPVLGAELPIFP